MMVHGISMKQGVRQDGRDFGYVPGEDGGWFFTHMDTVEATIASLEVDSVDGDGGLTRAEAAKRLKKALRAVA